MECKEKRSAQKVPAGSNSEGDLQRAGMTWNLKASHDIMEAYLKEGELNLAIIPTQAGFLHLFSAWILDESLPWTMGEAPGLHLLFKYLKITFQLPSDTTVRNQLARIFAELHGKVVRELTVVYFYGTFASTSSLLFYVRT